MLSLVKQTPNAARLQRGLASFAKFDWRDPLNLEGQLTEEERLVRCVEGGGACSC